MMLFDSFDAWWTYTKNAARHLAIGICRIVTSAFCGLLSLLRALWRFLTRMVGKHPSIAFGGFLAALFLMWLVTFMSMRARAVSAEAQRDSIAWQYSEFKERHGYE